ncbi:MAG: leucine-rich repeat protein [Bacteroidales bacterium]|nr:leucine-rich repeat protein [Bacteroidales bacterium]
MKRIVVTVLAAVCASFAVAQPMPIGNRFYEPYIDYDNTQLRIAITSYENHTAKVLSYEGYSETIEVPEVIEYENEQYTVTAISDYAFFYKYLTRRVRLPSTIKEIGNFAFFGTPATITLPDSLESLGTEVFTVSQSTTYTIPAKLRHIAPGAFARCYATNFVVDSLNPYYTAIDGVLFSKDTSVLVAWPSKKWGSSYTIPEGVKHIYTYAFDNFCLLSSVTLPQSLRVIGARAFSLNNLTTLYIPAGVRFLEGNPVRETQIIVDSLNECYKVEDGKLLSIDGDTIYNWHNASGNVVLPDGIKVIARECFSNADNITKLTLPEGVTTICNQAFQASSFYTNIPSTVRYIGWQACESVKFRSLLLPEGLTHIGGGAFIAVQVDSIVSFPSTLKRISDSAFLEAGFSGVCFSEGLEEIGVNAFALSYGLDTAVAVRFPSTLRNICNGAFGVSYFVHLVFTGSLDTIGAQMGGSPILTCRLANTEPPMIYPGALHPGFPELKIIVPCNTVPVYAAAGGYWEEYDDSVFEENCESIETTADRYTYLMPNPASDRVTVASSFRIGEVELYDLNGKLLARQKVDGLQTALDISALAAGTYIVRVTTNNGTAYKKLIKN